MLGQKGVAQILIVIILLGGLFGGLFLVQQTQIFKPKAFDRLISAPINPVCKSAISSFSVYEPCSEVYNGFKSAKFSCQVQVSNPELKSQGGEPNVCRTIQDWARIADQACGQICKLIPLPVPEPIGEPVCPAEFPKCDGELIEFPDSSGCSRYICVNQIQVPIRGH